MNKRQWIYIVEKTRRQEKVGIMHEPSNGHFLIHYAGKPIEAAKDVFDSREFRFFIDDELCIIQVHKEKNGSWDYILKFDEKADTPLNAARNKLAKKHLLQSIAAFSAIAVLLVSIFIIGAVVNYYYDKDSLIKNGYITKATILDVDGSTCTYAYQITTMYSISETVKCGSTSDRIEANKTGLPIEKGFTYYMKYDTEEYTNHEVYFDRPTEETILELKEIAANKLLQNEPNLNSQKAACIIDQGYKKYGLKAVADYFFMDALENENSSHNRITYKQRAAEMKGVVNQQCQ